MQAGRLVALSLWLRCGNYYAVRELPLSTVHWDFIITNGVGCDVYEVRAPEMRVIGLEKAVRSLLEIARMHTRTEDIHQKGGFRE